jgi:DNA-binding HxlR family transcriptional regulator
MITAVEELVEDVTNPCGENSTAEGLAGIRDALYVLNGKWKLPIIFSLISGPKRFKELQRALGDITSKVLSNELKELEMNEFVIRRAYETNPVTVIYELTPYSKSLKKAITELKDWGIQHRQRIVKNRKIR